LRVPFDGKQSPVQRWHGDAAERLQRMQGADRCAMSFQNAQDPGALRTTGVQGSPAAQFRAADARQILSDGGNFVIRRSDENHLRRQNRPRYAGMGAPRADETNGFSCVGFFAGNDRAYLPSQFPETAPQRATHASGTYDGEAILHHVLA